MELRLGPAVGNLFRPAHEADAVDLRGGRQGADRDRHGVALSFDVYDILEKEGLTIRLLETAKLPAHQRHQLGILVDLAFDSDELAALFERLEVLPNVAVILLRHCDTLREPFEPYHPSALTCQARVAREAASLAQSNGFARGLASRGESNSSVGSLNLHDWCFRLAQRAPSLLE